MIDDFLLRALSAGVGVAMAAGPLGSFLVWRRMAYFGDALSHTALLGVALGLLLGISINLSVILICVLVASGLVLLQRQRQFASDTLLGIMAHSTLSLGLVALSLITVVRVDLMQYLFGDILAVSGDDVGWIYGGVIVVLGILAYLWRPLLAITVQEDLARVEGVKVARVHLAFMLLIAVVIASAMKVVGVLLVTSLMIIPAAAARNFARTPEQMALFAAIIGAISVAIGLWFSMIWDTPTGPSIVSAAALIFIATASLRAFSRAD